MHNTETTYLWEKKGGQWESFSEDAYIYDVIPIDLAGCDYFDNNYTLRSK